MNRTDWCAPIDSYCERVGPGFWAEPVNAASNAAFLVSAVLALALWRRSGGRDGPALALIGVVLTVGVGSFLFHTYAQRWSLLADVVPIMVFVHGYLALALRRFLGLGPIATFLALAGFVAFGFGFAQAWTGLVGPRGNDPVNGSAGYFPPALAMLAVGGCLVLRGESAGAGGEAVGKAGRALLGAAAVFAVSLLFRSVDHAVCGWWPLGTHFAWHGLNAVVLFLLVRAAIRFRPSAVA